MGRAWVFDNNVSTDYIIPGRFNISTDINELRKHVFKYARPEFSFEVRKGDVILGGQNFGCGSSREHAALALKACEIHLIAESYGWIFKRNCVNTGVLPLTIAEKPPIADGSTVKVDLLQYSVIDLAENKTYRLEKPPQFIIDIYKSRGLIEYLNWKNTYQF